MIIPAQTEADRDLLLNYLAEKIGEQPRDIVGDMPFHIIGAVRDNKLCAVICFLNFRRQSIEFHLTVAPGALSLGEIRRLFAYPFEQLQCLRLWCIIRRNNKQARLGAERLGFKVLGVLNDEFGPKRDGILYSMRRADCVWLKRKG